MALHMARDAFGTSTEAETSLPALMWTTRRLTVMTPPADLWYSDNCSSSITSGETPINPRVPTIVPATLNHKHILRETQLLTTTIVPVNWQTWTRTTWRSQETWVVCNVLTPRESHMHLAEN